MFSPEVDLFNSFPLDNTSFFRAGMLMKAVNTPINITMANNKIKDFLFIKSPLREHYILYLDKIKHIFCFKFLYKKSIA